MVVLNWCWGVFSESASGGADERALADRSYDSRLCPTSLPRWKTPHLTGREKQIQPQGESDHRAQDAGANKPAFGLVQVSVLEGGDGADVGRPAVLGKNNICKRDRCKCLAAAS